MPKDSDDLRNAINLDKMRMLMVRGEGGGKFPSPDGITILVNEHLCSQWRVAPGCPDGTRDAGETCQAWAEKWAAEAVLFI